MRLVLLDAGGRVVGVTGPAADETVAHGPRCLAGLQRGDPLPQQLAVQGDDADAAALRLALDEVLAGRRQAVNHRCADGRHTLRLQTCHGADSGAAFVLGIEGDDPDDGLRSALVAAERRLAAVQLVAGLGSWYVDTASGQVQWSPETYRVLGVDPAQGPLDSAAVRRRVHPDDLPRLRADRARVLAGESLVTSHFRFRRDDGVECWLESRVTLEAAAPGRRQGIVGTVRDVSDSTRTQQALQRHRDQLEDLVVSRTVQLAEASERAEVAGRVKSAFLTHTSHEVRTPLNVIVSLAHLLHGSLTDPAQRDRAHAVEQAARHLGSLIDDVLAVASEDGAPAPRPSQALDVVGLLHDVAAIVQPLAQARAVQLDVSLPGSAGPPVRGDAPRLRQALLNALGHALAAGGGARVRLSAQWGAADGGQVPLVLQVHGDRPGHGAEATQDPQREALQRLARQLNAPLRLERLPDGGSLCQLTVALALEPGASPATVPPVPLDAPGQIRRRHAGRRVLLAEDDDISQLAMMELLADVGLVVDTADNGHEAVDLASRRSYALVLLDLRMPRLDGVGAARTIRALPGHQTTPMVAITANAFDEDRLACRAAGMNDFMAKPVEVPRLYEMLLRWLDQPVAPQTEPVAAPAQPATPPEPPAPPPAAPALPAAPATRAVPPEAADGMQPLLGLEGVDALGGLASVGGRPAVYRRLLRVFGETHAGDGRLLQQLLQRGDTVAAGSLAHRMRGSAATLGLIDVEIAAAALEGAIDQPSDDAPQGLLAQAVSHALDTTLQRLRAALGG